MDQSSYIKRITELKRANKLHSFVEERICHIINYIAPEQECFKEIQGLAGGRNDVMAFEYNGRKILFEIFATQSQVSRDLRILDNTKADVKIAIILDKEIDKKVYNRFIRENPENNYKYFFLKELFFKEYIPETMLKLRKLIKSEDEALFKKILNDTYSFEKFKELCEKEGLELIDTKDLENEEITFEKLFNHFILAKIIHLTKDYSLIEKFAKWLARKEVFKYALSQLQYGFNLFLYTDLKESFALYSDLDLVDWLRIGNTDDSPYVLLSINSIVNSILELKKNNTKELDINFIIGNSFFQKTTKGNQVFLSIPSNTKNIIINKPWKVEDDTQKVLSEEEILKMITII